MLDIKMIRENPKAVNDALIRRGVEWDGLVHLILERDADRRDNQTARDGKKAEVNLLSRRTGEAYKLGNVELAESYREQSRLIGEQITSLDENDRSLGATVQCLLVSLPNIPAEEIPTGGEDAALIVKEEGQPRKFAFKPFDHLELCERLRLVNFEAGSRISGSGFPMMIGQGAMLQRALINYMLDLHIGKHGYVEVRPPFLVKPWAAFATGQLPKFADQMYHVIVPNEPSQPEYLCVGEVPHYYLIPTSEVPVANMYFDQLLDSVELPLKFCAYSPCFRTEAGSYGKDARGLTRLHQFEKVELVRIAAPEASWDSFEQMTRDAETVLETLGLAYRRKLLPSGDMAFASAKTYDLEVYCPAEGAWREVSSISNTTEYQSRRMNLRIRRDGGKPEFPHLLNASGVALPRLMIAVLETYQTAAGTVEVPAVLRQYLPGIEEIAPGAGAPFI